MHRLRRSFCKQWWQDRWRDLISAYLAELGQGQAVLSIGVAPGRAIALKAAPITYLSPIRTIEKEDPESAVEESMDDADLLYDETDDLADDLDDEVDEAAE
jgi:chromosomal replication initiation ATPase DnaA